MMKRISNIGGLLKRIHRVYNACLLKSLQNKGFIDLRPSFLEILLYICDHEGTSIKSIGEACGLKKQTMTGHLNELLKRGYISRSVSTTDKREQNISLTEYGEKFKMNLYESINEMEGILTERIGDVELDRVEHLLKNFQSNFPSVENYLH